MSAHNKHVCTHLPRSGGSDERLCSHGAGFTASFKHLFFGGRLVSGCLFLLELLETSIRAIVREQKHADAEDKNDNRRPTNCYERHNQNQS